VRLASFLIIRPNHPPVVLAMRTWAVWQSSPWILATLITLAIVGNCPVSVVPTHRLLLKVCAVPAIAVIQRDMYTSVGT
jgi:hypothetical protein